MVAIADINAGRAERERMVTLAVERGWIQKVCGWAKRRGRYKPVAVLATHKAKCPGPLGDILKRAVAKLGHLRQTTREQLAEGLPPYVVFVLPLEVLQACTDPHTACDLQEAATQNQYAVLCMNEDREALISGVCPIGKDG